MTSWTPPPNTRPPEKQGMSTLAIVAIVLGGIVLVVVVFGGIVAAIAIPSILRARAAANEAAAVGTLRTFGTAEASYYEQNGAYGDVDDLVRTDMIDANWRDGMERNGFRFRIVRADENGFEAHAEPVDDANERSFTITEDFMIRYAKAATAPPGTSGRILGEG